MISNFHLRRSALNTRKDVQWYSDPNLSIIWLHHSSITKDEGNVVSLSIITAQHLHFK